MRENAALFGGDLLHMTHMLEPLGWKKFNEKFFENDCPTIDRDEFLQNMLSISDTVLRSTTGWMEISDAEMKHAAASRILESVDEVGFIYLWMDGYLTMDQGKIICKEENKTFHINHNMNMQLLKIPRQSITNSTCYSFKEDTICLPAAAYGNITNDCITNVATFINFDNAQIGLFPSFFAKPSNNQSSIVSLSINNGGKIDLGDEDPVQITFYHPEMEVIL
jgi:hypothetical protein